MENRTTTLEVHREDMLQQLMDTFEAIRAGGQTTQIINYWGLAGIGKSYLLHQAFRALSARAQVYWLRLGPRSAPLSTPEATEWQGWSAVIPALRAIPGLELLEPPRITAETQGPSLSLIAGDGPVVLLVDDAGDFDQWRWLQNELLRPVVNVEDRMIVVTSHIELYWDYSDLRIKADNRKVKNFSDHEVERYLEAAKLDHLKPLTSLIYEYTNGYPLAIDYFVRQLQRQHQSQHDGFDLNALSAPTRSELMGALGVSRLAEVEVLLGAIGASHDQERRSRLREALAELRAFEAPLVSRTVNGLPMRLDAQVRASVRQRMPAEAYLEHCRTLAEVYRERVMARPVSWAYAFLEWLYFILELVEAKDAVTLTVWPGQFHMLLQRLQEVQDEHSKLAMSPLYTLFCRDSELIATLHKFDRQTVEHLVSYCPTPLTRTQPADSLYDYVNQRLNLLYEPNEAAGPFEREFDLSCGETLEDLFERLGAAAHMPPRLQRQSDFLASMKIIFTPTSTSAMRMDRLLQDVSRAYTSEPVLQPAEVERIVDFLGSRGLLDFHDKERTYSYNPLLLDLVAHTRRRSQIQNTASLGLNSPQ